MTIIKRTVLFGDCDPAGYVYTPRVSYFVIEAVNEFLSHKLGGSAIRQIMEQNILPPARALAIEFTAPMTWDDELSIEVTVGNLGTHSFSLSLHAKNEESILVFKASLTQVCVSPETKKPVEIPERLAAALRKNMKI